MNDHFSITSSVDGLAPRGMSQRRVFAVIPAAGASQRMGTHKLLLPWKGRTLLEHCLAAWTSSRVNRTAIVLRGNHEDLIAGCRRFDVDVVVAERPPDDMKASVQLALAHIARAYRPTNDDAWMLAPADMPQLTCALIERVRSAYVAAPARRVVVPVCRGRQGHPVAFAWEHATAVGQLADGEGIRALLQRFPVQPLTIADAAILSDVDTPDQYDRLISGDACPDTA